MEISKQYYMTISIFVGALVLEMILSGLDFKYYIDIPNLIIIGGFIAIGHYYIKEKIEAYVLGSTLLGVLIGLVAILANLKDIEMLGNALSVLVLLPLYAVIGVYFIYNNYMIFKTEIDNEIVPNEIGYKKFMPLVLAIALVLFVILLSGPGFGSYIDIPSVIGILALSAVLLVNNKYKQLLLAKNYIVGYSYAIILISGVWLTANFNNIDPEIFGLRVAIELLSMIYMIILYYSYLRKQFIDNSISTIKIEVALWFVSIYSILVFLSIFILLKN